MPVTPKYTRRTPEESILYNVIAKHWPWLRAESKAANGGKGLPNFIERAVNAYLACGKGSGINNFSHSIRIKYSDINSMVCATCIGAVRPFRAGFGHRQMASIREIESARPNLAICRSVAANLLRRTRMEPAFSARSCDFGAPKSGTIRVNHSIYFDNTRSASSGFLAARNC